mmetsp:Transcript_38009/g.82639  ORF Transcript_38009/g.82639 Transcript_38009/m.82639 type:complete len:265 (-) Transcript_38009:296-1090(-)
MSFICWRHAFSFKHVAEMPPTVGAHDLNSGHSCAIVHLDGNGVLEALVEGRPPAPRVELGRRRVQRMPAPPTREVPLLRIELVVLAGATWLGALQPQHLVCELGQQLLPLLLTLLQGEPSRGVHHLHKVEFEDDGFPGELVVAVEDEVGLVDLNNPCGCGAIEKPNVAQRQPFRGSVDGNLEAAILVVLPERICRRYRDRDVFTNFHHLHCLLHPRHDLICANLEREGSSLSVGVLEDGTIFHLANEMHFNNIAVLRDLFVGCG